MTLTRAWLGLVLVICLAVLTWDTWRNYADTRRHTVERLNALAKVVEARTGLALQTLDMLLRDTANEVPLNRPSGDANFLRYLKGRSFLFTDALSISVVSPQGDVLHASNPVLVGMNVGERDYLTHFRAHPDDTRMFISRPSISIAKNPVIFTSRAVRGDDGGLRAVVVTGINPEVLGSLVQAALPSEDSGAIALLRADGTILARRPELPNTPPGGSLAQAPLFAAHVASGREQSVLQGEGGPDQFERLLVMRTLAPYGLVIVVTISSTDLWQPVLAALAADLVFLVIVALGVMVLARFLGGRERLRMESQRQLTQARDDYMRVLDHLPVHIWRSDAHGGIDYANGTLAGFCGGIATTLAEWVHPEDRRAWQDNADARLNHRASSEMEYRLRRQDGEYRWVHEVAQPFENPPGTFAGHLAACLDVTETREAQEKLTRSNAELEQFAYVASHDLREPLRMVSSYMGLIERRLGSQADGDIQEFLAFAKDGATRMDRLILDLLQYSRVGRMSAPRRALDLSDSLAVAMIHLGVALEESGTQICIGELPVILGSEDEMVRLFQNLIANAIKYAQTDLPPRITIDATREAAGWRISVTDNGIGIDRPYFDRVFRIFQRLHGREEHGGGSGIGLAVCKKIVETHGGRVWVDSPGPNQGSTFYVLLPAFNG